MNQRWSRWVSKAVIGSMVMASAASFSAGAADAQAATYNANPSVMDVGTKLRADSLEQAKAEQRIDFTITAADASAAGSDGQAASVSSASVGTKLRWPTHNDVTGKYSLTPFTLRAVGTYGEVWVADNLNYPAGDPRNGKVGISDAQVQYLLNQFDTNMYEKETSYFAPPKERTGEAGYLPQYRDSAGRVVILVDNIKDASYYDANYPSYIAGYFSPTISDLADRNIMTVDCYDWLNRMGANAAKPYLYEGVFAHEFQHLLHRDTDGAEENFINEGLSDFAQYLVGYGHSQGHIDFFMSHLKNSLTQWGDQSDLQILGDYGTAYLFQLYMFEHYGETFTKGEFLNQKQGVASINDVLSKLGTGKNFDQVYQDYMNAVLLDGKIQGDDGTYQFKSVDLHPDIAAASLGDTSAPAWGTDIKTIVPDQKIEHLFFKGIDFLGTKWSAASDAEKGTVLFGGNGDQIDHQLIKELDLTNVSNPVLTFDTKYNIEEQWDFGFVQVSTDNGQTWTSLANANTRSDIVDGGYPAIKKQMPGFTGSSGGWVKETFDLSAYAGKKVYLNFRYMTDWGYNEAGWDISNLQVNGQTVDPATSVDGFMSPEQLNREYVNYQVSFIGLLKGDAQGNSVHAKVITFDDLLNMSEQDRLDLRDMLHSANYSKVLMAVTYAAPQGQTGGVNYQYNVVMHSDKK